MINSRQQLVLRISDFTARAAVAVGGTLGLITLVLSPFRIDILWFLAMLLVPVALVIALWLLLTRRNIPVPTPRALALFTAAMLTNVSVFGPFVALYLPLCGVVMCASLLRIAVLGAFKLRPYVQFERN